MSDLIGRKATVDKINERQRELIYCLGFENDMVKIMDIAKSIVIAMPPAQPEILACGNGELNAQPELRWIPVSERLPDVDGEYLITKKCFGWDCKEYYESDIAWYGKKGGWHKADEVIAWMPLPEPYSERREE